MLDDVCGVVNLKGLTHTNDYIRGRKQKFWVQIKGIRYLFKMGASNYEIWAELFASEVAKQCDILTADYHLAKFNSVYGVLTRDFSNPETENVIPGDYILKYAKTLNMNSPIISVDNSVEGIINALNLCIYNRFDYYDLWKKLIELWSFDGLLLESDRNATNWSLIKKGTYFCFAPFYDFSTVAMLNNNVQELLNSVGIMGNITKITDNIKYSLTMFANSSNSNFLIQFSQFCQIYFSEAKNILDRFNKIDIDLAISNIENKIGAKDTREKFPPECKIWLNKVIYQRLQDMNNIYEYTIKNKIKLKHL